MPTRALTCPQAVYGWGLRPPAATPQAAAKPARRLWPPPKMSCSPRGSLVRRPRALDNRDGPSASAVIDEIDRADDEFEAFLL